MYIVLNTECGAGVSYKECMHLYVLIEMYMHACMHVQYVYTVIYTCMCGIRWYIIQYVVTTIESQYLMKNQSYLDEILLIIFVRSLEAQPNDAWRWTRAATARWMYLTWCVLINCIQYMTWRYFGIVLNIVIFIAQSPSGLNHAFTPHVILHHICISFLIYTFFLLTKSAGTAWYRILAPALVIFLAQADWEGTRMLCWRNAASRRCEEPEVSHSWDRIIKRRWPRRMSP